MVVTIEDRVQDMKPPLRKNKELLDKVKNGWSYERAKRLAVQRIL